MILLTVFFQIFPFSALMFLEL